MIIALVLLIVSSSFSLNLRPIIGIVSETTTEGHSYIAASYVKYIESAGARVVPIINNITQDELKDLFGSINGVLFPGGGSSLVESAYLEVAKTIFELAKQANDKGDYFPLWGTCLGFQLLCVLQSGTNQIISPFDSENYSISLNFTDAANASRLYSMYTPEGMNWLSNEPITMNNHHYGVSPDSFKSMSSLTEFYTILSTNFDRKGYEFISSIEAIHYPFYGVQWHPEKNIFEWTTAESINHSYHAVSIAQTAANFLVSEARKSEHHFTSEDKEMNSLIYNYEPTYTGKTSHSFEQEYQF